MSDEIRYVSLDASVFGAADGAVAFLDMPEGLISPPSIEHMRYLGDVPSMFSLALRAMSETHGGRDIQQALAEHLGVSQQSISKWERALFAPRLTSSQWAKLIKLAIAAPDRFIPRVDNHGKWAVADQAQREYLLPGVSYETREQAEAYADRLNAIAEGEPNRVVEDLRKDSDGLR